MKQTKTVKGGAYQEEIKELVRKILEVTKPKENYGSGKILKYGLATSVENLEDKVRRLCSSHGIRSRHNVEEDIKREIDSLMEKREDL